MDPHFALVIQFFLSKSNKVLLPLYISVLKLLSSQEMEVEMMVLQDQLAQCASDLETCEEGRLAATRDSDNMRGEIQSLKKQLRAAILETDTALAQVAALKESEEAFVPAAQQEQKSKRARQPATSILKKSPKKSRS